MSLILDPGQFLMERKMLLELRRRGIRSAAESPLGELPWELPPAETSSDAQAAKAN